MPQFKIINPNFAMT